MVDDNEGSPRGRLAPSSVSGEAYNYLRAALSAGDWGPGQRIQDLEVATQLGVSRTPIREALHRLASDGLVEVVHGRGFVVRRFSLRELDDYYRARAFLEGEAVHHAANRMTDQEVWQLESSITEAQHMAEVHPDKTDESIRLLTKSNVRFHEMVLRGSRSRIFTQIVSQLMARPLVYRAYYWYQPEERLRSENQHRDIYTAIANRDADRARALMIEHTQHIASVVTTAIALNPQFAAPEDETDTGRTDPARGHPR